MSIQNNIQATGDDRRKYVRISLKAYGYNHFCDILLNGSRRTARLIDVTPAGARLQLQNANAPHVPGKYVEILLQLQSLAEITAPEAPIRSEIRWMEGREWGIKFEQELDCTVSELQRLLDNSGN